MSARPPMTRSRKILWALAAVVFVYVASTFLPSGSALLTGAQDDRSEAAELRSRVAAADAALADQDGFAARLAAARAAVPPSAQLSELIASIDRAVTDAGLQWRSGSPAAVPVTTTGQVYSLTLTVAGPARSLPRLLDALAGLDRLVVVDAVQVRGDADASIVISVRFFATPGEPLAFDAEAAAGQGG